MCFVLLQIKRIPRYFVTKDFHIFDSKTRKILNEYETNTGHQIVSIVNQDNKRTTFFLHQLIYEAYYGEIEDGYVIHHIDENKKNNNISNLQKMSKVAHAKHHAPKKYKDVVVACYLCGKMFLWTAKKQSAFYRNSNNRKRKIPAPFCSKKCCGLYGKSKQMEHQNKTSIVK